MAYLRVTLRKNRFINHLVQHFQKIMNMLHACIDVQFYNLKFSQKINLDFHVTTATVDLCMTKIIESLLRRAL